MYHPFFLQSGAVKSSENGQCFYIHCSQSAVSGFFFRFGGGRPFQSLTFHNTLEIPTACFTTSSSRVCPRASCNVFTLFRRSSHLLLHPLMPLPVVLSLLRLSCCLAPRFLMSLMTSGFARCLFPNVHSFWFLAQPCPWLVHDSSVPYAVREWHGWSSLCISAGGGQLLPGTTITLCPFLRLTMTHYG
jgi:hypothetical protein